MNEFDLSVVASLVAENVVAPRWMATDRSHHCLIEEGIHLFWGPKGTQDDPCIQLLRSITTTYGTSFLPFYYF
jgi:hypothetical protein